MRISDWSSDVCSSDLPPAAVQRVHRHGPIMSPGHSRFVVAPSGWTVLLSGRQASPDHIGPGTRCPRPAIPSSLRLRSQHNGTGDRNSVGLGNRVSVRVELGGVRIIKKKKKKKLK